MSHTIHGTFVSEKINKIRWRPDYLNDSHFFITGSWDNDQNSVKLWDFQENQEDAEIYPFLIAEHDHPGDITEAKFLNADYFITSSSYGSAHLFKIISENGLEPVIDCSIEWKKLHYFPNGEQSPCTSLTTYDNDIVTAGEDGRINLLNSQSEQIVRTVDNADSCSIHCVNFLKYNQVLTSNLRGQMKMWDLRSATNDPVGTFMLSGEQIAATCLEHHPTQQHLVVAGDEEGSLTIWDLRHNTYPVNLLSAHENSVSELHFHPDQTDQLFSCSTAGDVWHWSPKIHSISTVTMDNNVWLASDTIKNKLEVFTLMQQLHKPINSLDLNQNKIVCGCDNEAIYLINGINLFN